MRVSQREGPVKEGIESRRVAARCSIGIRVVRCAGAGARAARGAGRADPGAGPGALPLARDVARLRPLYLPALPRRASALPVSREPSSLTYAR